MSTDIAASLDATYAIPQAGGKPRTIAALDTPAAQVEANARVLTLIAAEARTHSPSDALAFRLDEWLVTHPDAPVSTGADYPNWTPGGAS